ncbi:MAG: T9SS type A sorting domain-containing protein [Pedobacter sp.]|nr:MAG: T9SS type A sorting domain-containing protein [Pedobacter sp.]
MNPIRFLRSFFRGLLCFTLILMFSVFATAQPANDNCGSSTLLTSGFAPTPVAGVLRNGGGPSTATAGISAFCGDAASPDVWYRFVAQSPFPSIRLTGMSANLRTSNTRLQVFNTSSCAVGTLDINSNGCASGTTANSLSLVPSNALTPGITYLVRVFTNAASIAPGTWSFNIAVVDVPPNNLCGTPTILTSSTGCITTTGNMYGATLTSPTNITAPDCSAGVTYDVWYRFVAGTTNPTISLSNIGTGFQNPQMQLLSNNCGSTYTPYYCGTTSINANYLNPGTTYFIRVFSTGTAPVTAADAGFDICIVDPVTTVAPANDDCAGAVNLSVGSNCANITGNMAIATPSPEVLGGTCAGPNVYDLWYKFKAVTPNEIISLSSIGANFLSPQIEILSGSCGSFTSVLCGSSPLVATTLTPGNTYYVRVYSTTGAAPNGNGRFNICIQTPDLPSVRFGNSYVNITQKTTGGVVRPGDTLEIRMTIHHAATSTITNLRFVDSIPINTTMLTGATDRLKVITNEGLTYKSYTLATGDDAGTYLASPPAGEYNIRMNLGFGPSDPGIPVNNTSTESVSATGSGIGGGTLGDRPRGGSGLLFATAYRVVVSGSVGDTIVLKPARFTYNGGSGDITLTATPYKLLISDPLSLCTNSIGVNNAAEYGGTFGSGATLNRPTDLTVPITGYSFVNDVSPYTPVGDGRYGLVKNMSPRQSTNKNANRQPFCGALPFEHAFSCNQRMYGHWYIDGDHTGTNDAIGNLPPDSLTSSGYMLMVNADYVASEVYSQTINNLCPDTYYEFSAWFRNICATCGVDSIGAQFTGSVTAPASGYPGVYPNLSFSLNGLDYYSTGEIDTLGWQKKGFVFRTGPSQTSASFAIRNNSQGGGGNDWVLDDISVATCTPDLNLVPVGNTNQCYGDQVDMNCDVISFFDNYVYYQWQVSHDNGANFVDTLAMGIGSPVLTGGNYVYNAPFPSFIADSAHHLVQYRIRVATSAANLYGGCAFFNSARIIVMVNNCQYILKTDLLSFNGSLTGKKQANLKWQTRNETAQTDFDVQKSFDGTLFYTIGSVKGVEHKQLYSFADPDLVNGSAFYRIILREPGNKKISNVVLLKTSDTRSDFISVTNPFYDVLSFDFNTLQNTMATIVISDAQGRTIRSFRQSFAKGANEVKVNNLGSLNGGSYILQVISGDGVKSRRVIKLNK